MRHRHFEALQPVCPTCRDFASGREHKLRIGRSDRDDEFGIKEGVLNCTNPECQHEYPIIDGVPLVVANLRSYVSENISHLYARDDLGATVESILGDCCAPGSAFDVTRQHLSSYAWIHYGDLDPEEPDEEPRPGSLSRLLSRGIELVEGQLPGPVIDMGCGVGRATFDLATQSDRLVLGVDVNFSMLRLARRVLRTGTVWYPRRRVGVVYDRREFPVEFTATENVDFWVCDASALPFPSETFRSIVAMNLLDSVHSPIDLLNSMGHALMPSGQALIACPYDWSTSTTPVESWLGGHSQRAEEKGSSRAVVEKLLATNSNSASSLGRLEIVDQIDKMPWCVRMHERSHVQYQTHLFVTRKRGRMLE